MQVYALTESPRSGAKVFYATFVTPSNNMDLCQTNWRLGLLSQSLENPLSKLNATIMKSILFTETIYTGSGLKMIQMSYNYKKD